MGSAALLSHLQLGCCVRRLDPGPRRRYLPRPASISPSTSAPLVLFPKGRRSSRFRRYALEDGQEEQSSLPQQQQQGGVGAAVEEKPGIGRTLEHFTAISKIPSSESDEGKKF